VLDATRAAERRPGEPERAAGSPDYLPGMSDELAIVRRFGPPSWQTRRLEGALRRSWLPVARSWRMTPRGIRLLQRVTEPGRPAPALRGSLVEPAVVGGRPAEWVRGPRALAAGEDAGMLLYLHGGGYVFGSPRTHRNLVSRLSHVTALPALSLDYRLPPVATLPAPLEDALAAYRELLDAGRPAERIVLAGDSAGGGLALTLALHAVEAGLPQPRALVLLSPWADLTNSGASFSFNGAVDPFLPPVALQRAARAALAGRDAADWRVSPVFAPAELLAGLPPTLVQVGSTEVLHDDATRVAGRIAEAGVPAELHVFERQPHVPPLWGGTPEARTSLREIARFLGDLVPQGASEAAATAA
jgi:epsilon-lactone hydrolase